MKSIEALERDSEKLDNERARSEAYTALIVKEQEGILEAAEKGISKINGELAALRVRLAPYVDETHPKPIDEKGDELKHRYMMKLRERSSLEQARVMADESIAAAKLHMIPGEISREPKAPAEPGYHGLEV